MKRSFMYDGAFLWNSIPRDIKESKSLSSFRTKIATHIELKSSTVYTIPVNRLPPYVLYITCEQIPNQTFLCSLYLVYIIIVNSFK